MDGRAISLTYKEVLDRAALSRLTCSFYLPKCWPRLSVKTKQIVGILVNNKEIKLSQYADDTTLTLDGSKKSLIASLKMLDDFYEMSGLRLNDTKTEAFWIGSNCDKDPIQFPGRNFKWPRYKVKL